MVKLMGRWRRRNDAGASATEYGLLVVGIAAIVFVVIIAFGGAVKGMFSKTCSTVQSKTSTGTAASCNT